jgi:NodT family efflux transporter outer membrane factor (OMF) lipoprotein
MFLTSKIRSAGWNLAMTAAILCLFSAACTVGPKYAKPSIEVPISYKETEGWKQAQPKDHLSPLNWWEIFNDPELNALEEQVNVSNQTVMQFIAHLHQAQALVRAAQASYYPKATIGASYSRFHRSSNLATFSTGGSGSSGTSGSSAGGGSIGDFSDQSASINISWEADLWGKIRRTVEANRESARASEGDLRATSLSVQAELAQDYFQLRVLDQQRRLLEDTASAYQKFLDLTKNRYASGVASRADVLQAEAQLKATQAQAIDVGVQRAAMEHAIAVLIGKPASVFSIPRAPLVPAPPAVPVGVPSELLERRPDIAAAERRVAAANAQIGVAVAAYYPTLTLGATGGFEASNLQKWLTWPSRFWSVGPSISETVFDGGLRRAQTDQARAVYDANVAAYRTTVLSGFQEVEDNLATIRILEEEAGVQAEALKAARQAVTVTLNQYRSGTVTYLNVIVAQAAALNNEITALNILGRRMTGTVLLVKAMGGGWQ